MNRTALPAAGVLLAVTLLSAPAHAESLRCNGSSAEVGDSRVSVLYKCGEPLLKDSYCAAVFVPNSWQPVPPPLVAGVVPCLPVDDWLYDRGPGNLMATVRFQSGKVQAILYSRSPQ